MCREIALSPAPGRKCREGDAGASASGGDEPGAWRKTTLRAAGERAVAASRRLDDAPGIAFGTAPGYRPPSAV